MLTLSSEFRILSARVSTLQAIIAIGSGGMTGKGWMNGTQAHWILFPSEPSDFLVCCFSEEFGFFGDICLLGLYTLFDHESAVHRVRG